ncbi:ScyD/ScyE family protein [Candidatus Nephthysia bennettiae]|uniref:ScyD/ScyE family protein n=1 Tax=Candidatus Nephthysia bennettiae TaxID=3127016 RepID=A0A934K9G4_9BACT|nr:ScyD/ScyE family protein [Candidatus Dormibacteraeota bacterium]MBJ7612623.1 ScyD/ScyE family protein [Candidatus Dormibacteraeota bacterium]
MSSIAAPGATTVLAHSGAFETVATGLDNPRGLVPLGEDRLAVAEAGHAGPVCIGPGLCLGLNGQVTSLGLGDRDRTVLASGLPSISGAFGAFGLGGIALHDRKLYFVVGLNPQSFGDPAVDCQGQADYNSCVATVTTTQRQSGFLNQVRSVHSNHGWDHVAGVGRFDFDYAVAHPDPGNPEYQPGDANPFGVTAGPAGGFYVVDAASNTLDFVSSRGVINVLAFIPDPPNHQPIYDAAPTCAARTPNGDVYIGTETNSLWRWDGRALTKVLSGGKLGQVIGCVADRHGNIYLANLSSMIRGTFPNFNEKPFDGSIVKVTPRLTTSYVATGLNYPTGLTLDEAGTLYVALNGLCPKDLSLLNSQNSPPGACPEPGKVVRLRLEGDD